MSLHGNDGTREAHNGSGLHFGLPGKAGKSGSQGGEPALDAAWQEAQPAIAALDAMDLPTFRTTVGRFAAAMVGVAEHSHAAATLLLYDMLRTTAERLATGTSPDRTPTMKWITALSQSDGPLGLIQAFLGEIDTLVAPYSSRQTPVHTTALRARRFIDAHATEQISLSRVAKSVGVAPSYLSSLFRREYDQTLTDYIHQIRIRRAEVLLRTGDRSIGDVARTVGYQSYRHFYRTFLKLRKLPPKAYLKEIRSGNTVIAPLAASAPPSAAAASEIFVDSAEPTSLPSSGSHP